MSVRAVITVAALALFALITGCTSTSSSATEGSRIKVLHGHEGGGWTLRVYLQHLQGEAPSLCEEFKFGPHQRFGGLACGTQGGLPTLGASLYGGPIEQYGNLKPTALFIVGETPTGTVKVEATLTDKTTHTAVLGQANGAGITYYVIALAADAHVTKVTALGASGAALGSINLS